MASKVESFWRVLNDKGVQGEPISVGGTQYDRGLGVHADSRISFPLNGRFAAYHVVPGPDDAHGGLVEMRILVDGDEVFAGGKVRSTGFEARPVTIPVKGAKELTLLVTDGGDGPGGDHACWANAYLTKQPVLPTPPEIWAEYDPDEGDFREEVVTERVQDGIYYRESYISAYVNDEEIRVYCRYSVKAGATNAPGLMDVHGWMAKPHISPDYVSEGWAVMAHDYCGQAGDREHYTRYPESMSYGQMDPRHGGSIWSHRRDRSSITDPTETSDYLWYAIQRRVLSYLLAQKEVDPTRIGAKGYSYGGTIMWNLGMDERVSAIVAYFGIGWNEYYRGKQVWRYNQPYREPEMSPGEQIYLPTMAPQAHCPHITAATLWLNGSNDHHGGHERGGQSFEMFKPGVPWDFAIQARGHHNTEKLGDNCRLWLEKHVLGNEVAWPGRPVSEIRLGSDGVPELHVAPASPGQITKLKAYYALKNPVSFGRAWRDVEAAREDDTWVARLPVLNVDDYVFGFANIRYAGNIVISTDFEAAIPSKLGDAVATDEPTDMISEGTGMWSDVAPVEGVGGVKGFRALNRRHGTISEQFSDAKWKAPPGAQLSFKFYCTQPQDLVLVVNHRYEADIEITASDEWQTIAVSAERADHRQNGSPMGDWSRADSIQIKPKTGADLAKVIFAEFKWLAPKVGREEIGE